MLRRENVQLVEGEPESILFFAPKTNTFQSVRIPARIRPLIQHYYDLEYPYFLPFLKWQPNPKLTKLENEKQLRESLRQATKKINYHLEILRKRLGFVQELRTHTARHSFASIADRKIADKRQISAMLGHTDLKTTQLYLDDLRADELDEAAEAIFN